LAATNLASDEQRQLLAMSLAQSRAMLGGIQLLTGLTQQRTVESASALAVPDPRFASEQACCSYLFRRFLTKLAACAKCPQRGQGTYIAHNRAWQCAGCGAQTGIRRDTVLARSQIALVPWFQAIRILLLRPQTATSELAAWLGIARKDTVRSMRERIEKALKQADASQRLAELDQAFLGCD
jgi:hypothetical protein